MGALVDYYTEPSDKHAARWRGPATIVALERDLVLVRHGAGYFRRHPHHVRLRMPGTGEEDAKGAQDVRDTIPVSPAPPLGAPGNKKEDEGLAPGTVQIPDPDQSPVVPDQVEQEVEQERDNETQEVPEEPRGQDPVSDEEKEAEPEVETKDHGEIAVEPEPKFDLAKLLSGIARVKNSSALAVEDDPVVSKVTVPAKMAKTEGFHEAKVREIKQWERKRVMKSVKDENYPLIDTTWVFTQKVMASGKTKEKARLVARGF